MFSAPSIAVLALLASCFSARAVAQRADRPADFAREVVTAVVELPADGSAYAVEAAAGATLLGPTHGTSASRRLLLSLHLSERFGPGLQRVATVEVGSHSVPVVVEVRAVRRLAVRVGIVLAPGRRDSVRVVILNRGNSPERATLVVGPPTGVHVSAAGPVGLLPGDSATVMLRVATERTAAAGVMTLEARSGEVSAHGTISIGVLPMPANVPIAVQAVAGPAGPLVSAFAERTWGDSVTVRLNVGPRPPAGFGQVFPAGGPRAFSVTTPAWRLSVGEVRRTADVLRPAVAGLGVQGQFGRGGGWLAGGTLARAGRGLQSVTKGIDGAFRAERRLGATRFMVDGVSRGEGRGARLSVLSLGIRAADGGSARWLAELGLAAGGGDETAVGRFGGGVTAGAFRLQGEVSRSAEVRMDALSVREQASGRVELGERKAVFVQGSAARTGGIDSGGRGTGMALLGVRLESAASGIEIRGGWQGSDGTAISPPWSALVAGSSIHLQMLRTLTASLGHDHAWSAGGEQANTRANLGWVLRWGNVWAQAERGRPLSPFVVPDSWRFGVGAQLGSQVWRTAFNAAMDDAGGGWTASGTGEVAWRARADTDLLLAARRTTWADGPFEVFVGVRRRLGLPLPSLGSKGRAVRYGELAVRVAFASVPAAAVELVPRGNVRLLLPGGASIEAPLENGQAVFAHLPAGLYHVQHIAPPEALLRVTAVANEARVAVGRRQEVVVAAAYLPRTLTVVDLDARSAVSRGASGTEPRARPDTDASESAAGPGTTWSGRVRQQQTAAVVTPGMSEAEVVRVLGPARVRRTAGMWTYLFYSRTCRPKRSCGSEDDVVFLRAERVVTAYLRGRGRRYEGPAPARALRSSGRP